MDTSNPSVLVNGDILPNYVGRRVRIVIQVLRPDVNGLIGISTDDKQINVKGRQLPSPVTTFVEVIGVADTAQSLEAETVTNFGDAFDKNNFNQLCQLANGEYRHLFI
ncbi:replication protein A 14 kDa subunit B-like [Rutidosis leptorrhynchoides]|uniref:replication protein A 14 kDa subunit B-like n=1 Tax=Rutidosis leptorrhynchoides TaxID=125765 RepID=UPI003A99B327